MCACACVRACVRVFVCVVYVYVCERVLYISMNDSTIKK